MPFSAYDTHAVHILSQALSRAMAEFLAVQKSPTEEQIANAKRSITKRLMIEYDAGERDPNALARSAARAGHSIRM